MMIVRSLGSVPSDFGPCALTIGNFDGVHAGHREILRRVTAIARQHGWKAAAVTFDPHPTKLVAPDRAPRLLTTPERRCELMRQEGIESVLILPFTSEIATLSPEEFVREILVNKLQARAVLVGDNFRFGSRAAGTTATLREQGSKYGFEVDVVNPVERRHRMVSSSEIRRLITSGEVALACRLLETPYALEGRVVSGQGVGSKRTVPTLNLDASCCEVLPARGVYITRSMDLAGARQWNSVTNVGFRPTFDGDRLTVETFLLDPLVGADPEKIRVQFLRRLRDERKFDSPEALKAQILKDVTRAQTYFRRTSVLYLRMLTR